VARAIITASFVFVFIVCVCPDPLGLVTR
jgi:hypothetical protein